MMNPKSWHLTVGCLLLLGACGCSHATPRTPAFYESWRELPENLRADLEDARTQANRGSGTKLHFARVASRLARFEADLWLECCEVEDSGEKVALLATRNSRQSRLTESVENALSLYQQCELQGYPLSWSDRLQMVWLLTLGGYPEEARLLLEEVLLDPALPSETAERLQQMTSHLSLLQQSDSP